MTRDEAAAALDKSEYGEEGSNELWREMKASGLVALYGASDDLMEFRGAVDDEVGCYGGGEAFVTSTGLFTPCECDCKYSRAVQKAALRIEAIWCDGEGEPAWTYELEVLHSTFVVLEDGDPYCRGVVFSLADLQS